MAAVTSLDSILTNVYRFLRKVNKYFPIKKAYFFGSYSSGIASAESDIDVAIISTAFTGSRFEDNVAVSKLTWGVDTRIEPITFRPEQFNRENMLASEILTHGIELDIHLIQQAQVV